MFFRELTWGNQEPIWPLSPAALTAVPTPRIQSLAEPKRDVSLSADPPRNAEDSEPPARGSRTTSTAARYKQLARLATPKNRPHDGQEPGRPLATWGRQDRSTTVKATGVSPRLFQLASPKKLHPDFRGDREPRETLVPFSTSRAQITPRLDHLSLPKTRAGGLFFELGRPEEPIRPVSENARRATVTPRIKDLAVAKRLSKDYVPMRDPVWRGMQGKN